MLQELSIRNLALIDQLEISFQSGLNVLTGETGAGKSILMQALALLLGDRADADKLGRNGKSDGTLVEGAFDLSRAPFVTQFLTDHGISAEENQLLVSREVSASGRSKIRINGHLSTVGILHELGGLLVDLHGQHDHQRLLQVENHGKFLDNSGDAAHAKLLATTREAFNEWHGAQAYLDQLTGNVQQRAQRLDMLSFQLKDIEEVSPQSGEEEELREERERLLNAEKLHDAAGECYAALQGDADGEAPGAITLLGMAIKAADELAALDPRVNWINELRNAHYAIEDAAAEAINYLENIESSPQRLEEIESRLYDLGRLKRKYGQSIEAVLQYYEEISKEVADLSLGDEEIEKIRKHCEKLAQKYETAAAKLTRSRQSLSQQMARLLAEQLQNLAIANARFEVNFTRLNHPSRNGNDAVEFLFSANPGMPLRPLSKVASGGEISRLMLALRIILARAPGTDENQRVPLLVFDEIDTGIGGVTAEAVGEKLKELSRDFQVFCITHLPQIARHANYHLRVAKDSNAASTRVQVKPLGENERVCELARMMGHESDANLRHARQLLEDAH